MILFYTTKIDTIAIQIYCDTDSIQRDTVEGLIEFLQIYFNSYIVTERYSVGAVDKVEHKLYCNNRTVFTIQTGFSHGVYYIKIIFAGLSTYDPIVDQTSIKHLWVVMGYINTFKLPYNLAELDIAIDIPHVDFNQLLVFCSSHTAGTQYHALGESQHYDGETYYIEMFANEYGMYIAIKRAYLYDKRTKEFRKHNFDIGYEVQRFEVKLQSKYFNRYGLDINHIQETLNKYHLLYFDSPVDKQYIIDRYNSYAKVTQREIGRMGLEQYRLYPDMEYINTFLYHLQTITLDDLNSPYAAV